MYQSGKDPNISYEKEVTIDDVVNEADAIWAELRSRRINPNDHERQDEFYREMFDKHTELARAYPIVMRYLCQMGCYSNKVFRRFIKKMAEKPHRSESDYLDLQAEYVKMLYMELNRGWDRKKVSEVYQSARRQLQAESDDFKNKAKKFEAELKEKDAIHNKLNASEFAKYVENNADFFSQTTVIPIRTDTPDVPDVESKLAEELKKYEDGCASSSILKLDY